jgi:putative FmdB family regulatory protein
MMKLTDWKANKMPTYEYTCLACDTTIDRSNVRVDDRDHQTCEDCGNILNRSWTIGNVAVWAPTSGGYR